LVSTAADYLRFAQMVLNKGKLEGVRLLGRKTVELMTANHLPAAFLPIVTSEPHPGVGFGLGFSVVVNAVETGFMCSEGNHGWSGAASTHFWLDPQEQLIGLLLLQYFPYGTYPVTEDFRTAVYQALVD
jgi:CubicO group peptidase (beta-lactamase class C family)